MKYDCKDRCLYTDHGDLIKQLDCPLHKKWDQLQVVDEYDRKRWCGSCKKNVISILGFNDRQVQALVEVDEEVCLYASSTFGNVAFIGADVSGGARGPMGSSVYRHMYSCVHSRAEAPVITTARTVEAINKGVRDGYWPVLKAVLPSAEIKTKTLVTQNPDGSIKVDGDLREALSASYIFEHNPYRSPLAFAAYLIPRDLEAGTRVFIPDLIEDILGRRWNQGDTYRRNEGFAVWDGKDLVIEEKPVGEFVG